MTRPVYLQRAVHCYFDLSMPKCFEGYRYNLIESRMPLVDVNGFMLTSKLKELAQYKAKVAKLENAIESARVSQLRGLHTEVGFDSRDELIAALRGLGQGAVRRGRPPKKAGAKKAGRRKGKGGRKGRAVITPELRSKIESAARGSATGQAIAKKFDVSLPTVQNIKRAAGLTRKKKR